MDIVPFSAYFPYIHPTDADALALTCHVYRQMVDDEYTRAGRNALLPGGCWHHLLCKRARDSVSQSYPNNMPKALASLVDSKCIGCQRPLLARVSVWGFAAHPQCIRHMLVNVFYIPEKFGLNYKDLRSIPRQELEGYRLVSRESYKYDVVFHQRRRRLVPREWTLQHVATVLYAHKVRQYQSNQRKARDAAIAVEAAKHQKRLALGQRRTEAVAKRLAALEAHPRVAIVQRALHVVGKSILGSYLDNLLTPKTSLRQVVANAEKFDTDGLARVQVQKCLDRIIGRVEYSATAPTRPREATAVHVIVKCQDCRLRLPAKECVYKKCGICCAGCQRHSGDRFRARNTQGLLR
jgi:hypothetical protein